MENHKTDPHNERPQNIPLANFYTAQKKFSQGDFFIFDSLKDPFKKLWTKNPKHFPENLTKFPVIFKTELYKVGNKFHFLKKRLYYFTDDYLYYKQVIFYLKTSNFHLICKKF